MSKKQPKYTYGQQMYVDQNVLQDTYNAYTTTAYPSTKTTSQQVIYQDQYIEGQPQYVIQGNEYIPQEQYIQQGEEYVVEPNQNYVYEYQQVENTDQYGQQYDQQYYEQPQEIIYQDPQTQQFYMENTQQQNKQQRSVKYVQQMAQQKPNIKQNQQYQYQAQEFVSRNPNMKHQYQKQNIPQQPLPQQYAKNISYVPPVQKPPKYQNQMVQQEKPLIESDFAPDFQVANSVLNQSQIPFEEKKDPPSSRMPKQVMGNYQNQKQQVPPSYVIPRRNPNANITKYELSSSSHYINTADPGSSTVPNKNINNNLINTSNTINQMQSLDKSKNLSGEQNISIKNKTSNSSMSNQDIKPEVGAGVSCLENSEINSNINNNSNIKKSNISNNMMKSDISNNVKENNIDNQMNENLNINEEIEQEKPIEEKVPDVSNMNSINESNKENMEQEQEQQQNFIKKEESGDIDDNLDHLPTVNSIMKGTSEMLPPPKKKKYN